MAEVTLNITLYHLKVTAGICVISGFTFLFFLAAVPLQLI